MIWCWLRTMVLLQICTDLVRHGMFRLQTNGALHISLSRIPIDVGDIWGQCSTPHKRLHLRTRLQLEGLGGGRRLDHQTEDLLRVHVERPGVQDSSLDVVLPSDGLFGHFEEVLHRVRLHRLGRDQALHVRPHVRAQPDPPIMMLPQVLQHLLPLVWRAVQGRGGAHHLPPGRNFINRLQDRQLAKRAEQPRSDYDACGI
mmetsp:Transcript_47256/g.79100  ORF Transcript_47256/g.79100 Transcript_47256/m.79100 type:complete len:200 (+) Transcript_47256:923-1522(+)